MLLGKSIYKHPVYRLLCLRSVLQQGNLERFISDSSVKDKSLYRILGVNPKATQTEIKDAYYNLTLKFHPDKNEGSPEAAVKFREVTEAYEVLGNYFMRRRYDKGLPLPTRHETATVDVTVPHKVQYQEFFDRRNLPYQPSAYAAGGGAKKFEEYHSKQFSEPRRTPFEDKENEYIESCKSKKTPTLIAIVMGLYVLGYIKRDLDLACTPRITVEDYDY